MQVRFADTPTQKKLKRAVEYRQYLAEKNPGQMLTGQVRYADTPAQKELKRITAERRQFRTNEYNIGAYGTADVGIHPSIYQQGSWNRRAASSVNSYVVSFVSTLLLVTDHLLDRLLLASSIDLRLRSLLCLQWCLLHLLVILPSMAASGCRSARGVSEY